MSDDGFGPRVIDALREEFEFPPEVELVDGGTPGLSLAALLMDRQALIVVDAITAQGPPGELRLHHKCDLIRREARARLNPHEPALLDILAFLELAGRGAPNVLAVGAIPESIHFGTELSAPLRRAIPGAAKAVGDELKRLGVEVRVRPN
jgi:hydrogenase maturation protease